MRSCSFGRSGAELPSAWIFAPGGLFEHWCPTTAAGSGRLGSPSRGFDSQSNERAMFCAYASRRVSGGVPERDSIVLGVESEPEIGWVTGARRTHGESGAAGE